MNGRKLKLGAFLVVAGIISLCYAKHLRNNTLTALRSGAKNAIVLGLEKGQTPG